MIDWLFIFRHALWIAGAAIALSAWSYGRIERFSTPLMRAGALLFCIGFALVTPLWQAAIWTLIALFVAFDLWKT